MDAFVEDFDTFLTMVIVDDGMNQASNIDASNHDNQTVLQNV